MGLKRSLLVAFLFAPALAGAQSFDELIAKGRGQLDSNKAGDAVKSFERAIKLNDKSSDAHLWLARALGTVAGNASVLRQPFLGKRAKSEFDKAVELDPKSVGGREGLMQFYLRAPSVIGGSVAKAKEQAAVIATLSPYRGHFAAANIANNQKDPAGAEKAWRAAAAEFPDSLGGVVNLANFLFNNNRAEEAFAPLDKYLAKYPENISAQFWIARAAAASGKQLDRGEQILRTLLLIPADKTPRIAAEQLHLRLGDIALKRGDKAKAKSAYEEALKVNPRFEAAKKALGSL
jgi:tetratricopeptide (TPR) repeat protein